MKNKAKTSMKKLKSNLSNIILLVVALLCLVLFAFVLTVMNRYTDTVSDSISDKAELFSTNTNTLLSTLVADYEGKAEFASGRIKDKTDAQSFQLALNVVQNDSTLKNAKTLKYVKNGILYDEDGTENATQSAYASLIEATESGVTGCYGVVYDNEYNMNLLAFYAPVENNDNVDSVILYFPETILKIENITERISGLESAEFVMVCTSSGRIILSLYPDNEYDDVFTLSQNTDVLDELGNGSIDEDDEKDISALITGDENATLTLKVNGEDFAFSVRHNEACSDFVILSFYRANSLDSSGDTAISSIGSILILLCLALPVALFAVYFVKRSNDRQIRNANRMNEELNCLSLYGMQDEITKNIRKYPGSKFAVVGARIKHFRYLSETNPTKVNAILLQIRGILHASLGLGEIMGTADEGEFVLLLHYREIKPLTDRIWQLSSAIEANVQSQSKSVRMDFGIYEMENGEQEDTKVAITNAFRAIEADPSTSGLAYVTVFNQVIKENYMQSAEIEVKMDFALEHEEFKVFFQPKINVATDTLDGCEALIRWYDEEKGDYRTPGMFMPLFEQNGFIVKLDKFVFYKVCEFIGLRLSENRPIYPISVNISRLTALTPEFMDYYIQTKNQFGVPDNFITLELTESIASASYDTLNKMAIAFHENHFLLSIDDYGSGYSSINVLKNMRVDEIKMDRLFLDKGFSAESDKKILTSMVALGKDLGIKVVQEGVETNEQLEYVKEAGCTIIQGYIFAKPMSMLDYIRFMDERASEDERRARSRSFKNLEGDDENFLA